MSHPRPDPPQLTSFTFNGVEYAAVTREKWDALLSDLRTLEAQWRKDSEIEPGMRDEDVEHADGVRDCADDLAALLARLEGK
jgi:hypothetical protein